MRGQLEAAHQRAIRSGQITQACLDGGMSEPDACETAAVLLPVLDAMLARAWDEGRAAERRDWEFTFDLSTPDEDRQPWTNPYRAYQTGAVE